MRAVQGSWIRFACCSVILSASLAACGGGGGGSEASTAPQTSTGGPSGTPGAPVTPETPSSTAPNQAPQISGTPATAVAAGQTYSFTPTATDPDNDTVTFTIANKPSWLEFNATTGLLSGTAPAAAGTFAGIEISATDGEAVASLPAFTITVNAAPAAGGSTGSGSVSLAWTPPTQNDDGSTLTDLSGYKIHYGTESGVYSQTVDVTNPGLTRYALASLPQGQVFIAMTAVNSAGAQSAYSSEVAVTVN
jgi:hypothetical protein